MTLDHTNPNWSFCSALYSEYTAIGVEDWVMCGIQGGGGDGGRDVRCSASLEWSSGSNDWNWRWQNDTGSSSWAEEKAEGRWYQTGEMWTIPPTVSWRTCNPAVPDKWQRIAQIVFRGGYLEIYPSGSECISRSGTQHQGGGCRTWECDKKGVWSTAHQLSKAERIIWSTGYIFRPKKMKKLFKEDR